MKNKVLLIYNAMAGSHIFSNNMDLIIETFQRNGLYLMPLRLGGEVPVDLDAFFREMRQEEWRKIIAAGGDGTFHIVANAMLRCGLDLPLALFPAGTANDLAYYFDIPQQIESMMEIALEENYRPMDLGIMNGEAFLNVAALGPVVSVSQETDPNAKNVLGLMAYYLKGASELPKLKPVKIKLESEEFSGTVSALFMIIMNGCSAGGFRKLSPDADISDGLLDVILLKKPAVRDLPAFLLSIYQSTHLETSSVIYFQTKSLRVSSSVALRTDMDGEAGPAMPLEISILPQALRINVRAGAALGAR